MLRQLYKRYGQSECEDVHNPIITANNLEYPADKSMDYTKPDTALLQLFLRKQNVVATSFVQTSIVKACPMLSRFFDTTAENRFGMIMSPALKISNVILLVLFYCAKKIAWFLIYRLRCKKYISQGVRTLRNRKIKKAIVAIVSFYSLYKQHV